MEQRPMDQRHEPFVIRPGDAGDALCLGALATQVFLDTYATEGIRPALADEVRSAFGTEAMAALLRRDETFFLVAERRGHCVGLAQVTLGTPQPSAPAGRAAELDRLYVQERFTRKGLGSALLRAAEDAAAARGAAVLWLTTWVGNHRALAFYPRLGYLDCGRTLIRMQAERIENQVFARRLRDQNAQ